MSAPEFVISAAAASPWTCRPIPGVESAAASREDLAEAASEPVAHHSALLITLLWHSEWSEVPCRPRLPELAWPRAQKAKSKRGCCFQWDSLPARCNDSLWALWLGNATGQGPLCAPLGPRRTPSLNALHVRKCTVRIQQRSFPAFLGHFPSLERSSSCGPPCRQRHQCCSGAARSGTVLEEG